MGIKERRTKLLMALLLFGDLDFKIVSINEQFLNVFDISMNQKTKSTLNSLVKKGFINQPDVNNLGYSLSNKGFNEICLEFPYFRFQVEKWDGVWRILSYEIPEKKRELRDKLRREVTGWGLGPWHRSFWVTPHPIIPYLKNLLTGKEEQQYVQAFESQHVFGDRDILIEKVWRKSELQQMYKMLFKTWHDILSQDAAKRIKLTEVINAYVGVLRKDPGLPVDLLGKDWIGFEAVHLFNEIKGLLVSEE